MNQNVRQLVGTVSDAILSSMRVSLKLIFLFLALSILVSFTCTCPLFLSITLFPLSIFIPPLPPTGPLSSSLPFFFFPLSFHSLVFPCLNLQECQTVTFEAIKMDLTPANYHGHLAFNPDQEPYQVCYDMMTTFSSVEYEDRTIYYPRIKQ